MTTVRKLNQKDLPNWLKLRKALWPKDEADTLEKEMLEIFKTIDDNPVFLSFFHDDITGFYVR